jgi:diguanylate cyclase (GGDEF)-like protein
LRITLSGDTREFLVEACRDVQSGVTMQSTVLRRPVRGVALLVVAAAVALTVASVWSAGAIVAQRHARADDDRLQTAAQGARATVLARVAAAERRVSMLAASPAVQRAFATGDVAALQRLRRGLPDVAFVLGRRTIAAGGRQPSIPSTVDVFGSGRRLGAVVVSTAVGTTFLQAASGAWPLRPQDRLLVARAGRVAAGPGAGSMIDARPGTSTVELDGRSYRAAAAPIRAGALSIVALSPTRSNPVGIKEAAEAAILIIALILSGLAIFPERLRVRHVRAERRRRIPPESVKTVRNAVALVGHTLAATHDAQALLPVILSAAIEATGAAGGQILEDERVASSQAQVTTEGAALVLDLGKATGKRVRLRLTAPPGGFSPQAREAAGWFVEQASIALENAALHHLVQKQAVTDELTGLTNRRGFMTALARETSRSERFRTPLVFVLADIDDFKKVNDRHGHHVGDAVLVEFARILVAAVREIDVTVRLGGEEFGLLLPDTGVRGGMELAERLRTTVATTTVHTGGVAVRFTASFGVASHIPGSESEQLLIDADACLYQAKAEGKNRIVSTMIESTRRSGSGRS